MHVELFVLILRVLEQLLLRADAVLGDGELGQGFFQLLIDELLASGAISKLGLELIDLTL